MQIIYIHTHMYIYIYIYIYTFRSSTVHAGSMYEIS